MCVCVCVCVCVCLRVHTKLCKRSFLLLSMNLFNRKCLSQRLMSLCYIARYANMAICEMDIECW